MRDEAIVSVPVDADERRGRPLAEAKIAAAAAALRDDGVVVLADAVDPAHVAALRDRLLADLPRVLARRDAPFNFNAGNVQQSPPRERALLFRDVLFNDAVIAVTSRLLHEPTLTLYSGNTALPSDARQPVHGDGGHLWRDHIAPACTIIVNLPLVDMSEANGATQLWLGSHRIAAVGPGDDIVVPPPLVEARRAVRPPLQPTVRAGSVLLRDHRLWHAGMPNRSGAPRPMIAMSHNASWLRCDAGIEFREDTRSFFDHPILRTRADFRGDVDHTALDHPYGYAAETEAPASSSSLA